MRAVIVIVAAGVLTFLAALFGPAALAGDGDGRKVTRADLRGVNFVENCRFSHSAPDDPIVFPGKAGASHDHTFVGNRSTNASSTYRSLRASPTSCRRADDKAGYWVPTLLQGTTPVFPQGATIYYRRGTLRAGHDVPEQPPDDRGRRDGHGPAGHARDVLELRRDVRRPAVQHSADVPGRARLVPPSARALPELLGRRQARQRRPQEPHGVRDGQALPLDPSGRGAGDHADLPLPDPRRGGLLARLGRPVQRARGLPQRVAARRARAGSSTSA